jgi:hypothetical protein
VEAHRVKEDAGIIEGSVEGKLIGEQLLRRHRTGFRQRCSSNEDYETHRSALRATVSLDKLCVSSSGRGELNWTYSWS